MAEVVAFPVSPLAPYAGFWLIDPLSVGRTKKSISPLRDPGLAARSKCGSMGERDAMMAADSALAERYAAVAAKRRGLTLDVSERQLVFRSGVPDDSDGVCPIVKVTAEGRSVVADVISRQQKIGYVFRMQKSWLLVPGCW